MADQDKHTHTEQESPEKKDSRKKRINSVKDIRKRKTRKKRIITIVVLVALVGGGYLFFSYRQRAAAAAAEAEARATASHEVTSRIYREEVEVSGNVVPYSSENLFFKISGEVRDVFVEEGDYVSAGDEIAVLKKAAKEYELAQLEFEIEQARHDGSSKQLELLNMRKDLLEDEIKHTTLKAGISGRVSRVNIEPGDMVGTSPADPAVRIVDVTSMKATVEVDEFDINKVEIGQEAELIFDALGSGHPVTAQVYSIPLEGTVTGQGIAVKEIDLVIDDPPPTISPAYTFSGVIIASEEETVLTFPQNFIEHENDTEYVNKRRNDELVQVEVETAYFEAGNVRLISGDIEEGDILMRTAAAASGANTFMMGPPGGRR